MSRVVKTNKSDDDLNINGEIQAETVRLIDELGENVGVVTTKEALAKARAVKLDLVEISPNAEPPVCKIIDYGKYKYHEQKKAAEAKKKQKIIEVKEIKIRPGIEDHDYNVKLTAIKRFFAEGNKVKVTLKFRGREMAHTHLGMQVMDRIKADIVEIGKVDTEPKLEGKQVLMIISPNQTK